MYAAGGEAAGGEVAGGEAAGGGEGGEGGLPGSRPPHVTPDKVGASRDPRPWEGGGELFVKAAKAGRVGGEGMLATTLRAGE